MRRRQVLVGALAVPLALAPVTSCKSSEPKGAAEAPGGGSAAPTSSSDDESGPATSSTPDRRVSWPGLILARFGESEGEQTDVRVVDPNDGSTKHRVSFSLPATDGRALIPGGWGGEPWGWTQERYAFSPALDRLAVQTAGDDGGNKVGWVDVDGVFTDVSALPVNDSSVPDNSFANDIRPAFDPAGGFWASRFLPSSHALLHLPPASELLELVSTEDMKVQPMGLWVPVVQPDGSVGAFNVEEGGAGWLLNATEGLGCPLLFTADVSNSGMCLSTDYGQESLTILPPQPGLGDFPSFSDGSWTPSDYVDPILNNTSGIVKAAVFDPAGERIAYILDGNLDLSSDNKDGQSREQSRLYLINVDGGSPIPLPVIALEQGEIIIGWS